jgi:hypothetical protein
MAEPRSRERSLLTKALSPSAVCATPFELSSLADGSLAGPATARLQDHLSGCPRCQTELTLLNYFENAAPTPDEERTVRWISARLEAETIGGPSPLQARQVAPPPRRSMSTALNLAGFAVVAAAVGAAMTIGLWERHTPELTQPSPGALTVLRSAGITTVSPTGDLDAVPDELRWEPQTGAASYSVQVMEIDQSELWSAEARAASIALPRALQARIVPGKPLLWEVVAKDAAGKAMAWSGKQRFRISK